jgi:hypothetical protein
MEAMEEQVHERVVWRRKWAMLSCSRCNRTTPTIQVYLDPSYGEGWPLHRCSDFQVRPFDTAREGKPVPKEMV